MKSIERALLPAWVVCLCACAALGCGGGDESCPGQVIVEANPGIIPAGGDQTDITVSVENDDPSDSRVAITTLYAETGTFDDVHASNTTYTCDPETPGVVKICVDAAWVNGPATMSLSEDVQVGSSFEYLGGPHISDRPECGTIDCIDVVCPVGICPKYETVLVRPTTQSLGNLIDVSTSLRTGKSDQVKVHVDSNCGTVGDPVKSGESSTTVACDVLGICNITVWLTDDRYAYCTGMGSRQNVSFRVYCQVDQN
jgi:hypothetical protein